MLGRWSMERMTCAVAVPRHAHARLAHLIVSPALRGSRSAAARAAGHSRPAYASRSLLETGETDPGTASRPGGAFYPTSTHCHHLPPARALYRSAQLASLTLLSLCLRLTPFIMSCLASRVPLSIENAENKMCDGGDDLPSGNDDGTFRPGQWHAGTHLGFAQVARYAPEISLYAAEFCCCQTKNHTQLPPRIRPSIGGAPDER